MIVRTLLVIWLVCSAQAVLNKKLKRREAFDHYGPPPPRPAPHYGPPPSGNLPHREYGVPQNTPFRDYGPPPLKYGPSKLNLITSSSAATAFVAGNGLHEHIKNSFGVPKPFYGPPHIQHKPALAYGPPKPQYELLPRPIPQYGPPLQNNGPYASRPHYGAPHPSSSSSSSIASPNIITVLNTLQRPASSYGPPPSGPLHHLPQHYGPPRGPSLPNLQQTNKFHGAPETTVIVTGTASHNQHGPIGADTRPIKQVQIQVDSSGHTHSVAGSQAPFHTSCEGWKPIAGPAGTYIEQNHIEQQTGYSQVSQTNTDTHYHAAAGTEHGLEGAGGNQGGSNIVNGLTDEQIVAVALQAGNIGGSSNVQILTNHLSPTGPGDDYKQQSQNSIESNELHTLGAAEDSYSRPPPDSYAPGSIYAQKYTQIKQNAAVHGLAPPSGNYGPPLSPGGNPHSAPSHTVHQPSTPVAFRPPVPQGLIESIGSTVQHLDQFGVKPPNQPPTYIPPAANEIGHTSVNLGPDYAAPLATTHIIFEQQPPKQIPPQSFLQHQQQSQNNINTVYGVPSPPEPNLGTSQITVSSQTQQYLPPPPVQQSHPLELSNQQFVPPPLNPIQQPRQSFVTHQHSLTQNHLENAYSSSQNNEQFVHVQGLPVLQPDSGFHQVHDCGIGPNLIGTGYQSQQQQQQNYEGSTNSFNAIAPSIPIGEQHSHFVSGPADSYGPPPSGSVHDHIGLTSQKTSVNALPDGTDPQTLPGLDGLNVISAQKSQSVQINSDASHNSQQQQSANTYQLQFANSASSQLNGEQNANHEEILSDNLLQSILTAIEQPTSSKDEQQLPGPRHNHAQSRSDQDVDGLDDEEDEKNNIDANTRRDGVGVTKLKAIVPAQEEEEEERGEGKWNASNEEVETSNH